MATINSKLTTSKDILENLQNVQIYPSTERVEINDKFSKVIFKRKFKTAKTYEIVEKKTTKQNTGKKKNQREIITEYSVSSDNGDEVISLSEFERAVLAAIINEQKKGNQYTTINIIFRSLIGKVGEKSIYPSKNQAAAIESAITKLMGFIVNFKNVTESLKQLGYLDADEEFPYTTSSILPAALITCKINGQPVKDVLYFDRKSPLLELAEMKNQIVRYPAELLDVSNQNNTPLIIALKTYVLRRIAEIKLHTQLTPTITFADVFKKCRIDKVSKDQKYNCRSEILKLFEHVQSKKFISTFHVEKRGNSIYGVSFIK